MPHASPSQGLAAAHTGGEGQPHGHDAAAALAFLQVQRKLDRLLGGFGALYVVDEVAGVAQDDLLLHRLLHHLAELLVRFVKRAGGCS